MDHDGSILVENQISLPAGLAVPRPLMTVEMKQLWPPNGCCCRWRWIMKAKVNHSPLGQTPWKGSGAKRGTSKSEKGAKVRNWSGLGIVDVCWCLLLFLCFFPVFACKWSNGIRRSLTARTEAVVDPEVSRSICQDVGILQPTSGSQDFRWGPPEWGLMRFHQDLLEIWKYSTCFFLFKRKLLSCNIAALALLAFLAGPSFANFL